MPQFPPFTFCPSSSTLLLAFLLLPLELPSVLVVRVGAVRIGLGRGAAVALLALGGGDLLLGGLGRARTMPGGRGRLERRLVGRVNRLQRLLARLDLLKS